MTHERKDEDDSLIRYAARKKHPVWVQYDEVIVPQIIQNALAKGNVSLFELYQVLSVARFACEYEIKKTRISWVPSKAYVMSGNDFGAFQYGGSQEHEINNIEKWGKHVADLLNNRIGNDKFIHRGLSHSYLAVQRGSVDNRLVHPVGPVLDRLDQDFQKLLHTNNFFEFIKLAARLMYDLSNFPPITRGSLAVNTWIIDNVAKIKFGIPSIKPALHDWTAFLETPEKYTGFYAIAATAKYLETIPGIYSVHQTYLDSLPELLRKNPNNTNNLQLRETSWNNLKEIISNALDNPQQFKLNSDQIKLLGDLKNGLIPFRKPSDEIVQFVDAIKAAPSNDVNYEQLLTNSGYSREKLYRLLSLDDNLTNAYLQSYGNTKNEESLNADWVELEIIRQLPSMQLMQLMQLKTSMSIPEAKIQPDNDKHPLEEKYTESIDQFRRASFATWEDVAQIPLDVLNRYEEIIDDNDSLLKKPFQEAIWSGGIRLQDLIGLNADEIALVTSPDAIELYN